MNDPLGLTLEQRAHSNISAGLSRRNIWWPAQVDPIIRDHVEQDACDNCPTVDGHAPDCIGLLATTLHEIGLELDMQLVPLENA